MKRFAVAVALLAAALSGGAGRSQAVFTATSSNASQAFTTAAQFNAVTVSMTNPGSPLRATVPLSATATSDRTIVSVRYEYAPAGTSTWSHACTATAAPFGCVWDTTAVTDGSYDLHAIATDASGYSRTSATISSRQVDNTGPTVTVSDPGTPLTGTRTLSASATATGSPVSAVAIEYRTSPSGTWNQICNDTSAPYSCPWSTASLPDGLYDLRARATDQAGNTGTSTVVADRRVDNHAPAVSIPDDGPRSGMATVRATLDDGAGSGIASVRYEVRYEGTWYQACESATAPFSCQADTTQVPDGVYDLRAIATDKAGLSTTSATRSVRVDNTAPAVALGDPGTPLTGTETLTATASDGGGVASVLIERKASSASTWTAVCTDSTAPYSCDWDTTSITDGTAYDLRATATDNAGRTATSLLTGRVVGNGPRASAVTSTGTNSRPSNNDTLRLTYNEPPAASSLAPGWTGATGRPVSIAFTRSGTNTTVAVTDTTSATTVPLGALTLTGTFTSGATAVATGTMTLTGSELRLTLTNSPPGMQNATTPFTLTWTSAAAVTDAAGYPGAAVQVTGSGQL